MKFVALIPARYAATRFPFKLMQKISENKTVIQLTVENALNSKIFDDVVTVCDEDTIYNHILSIGAKAIKSKKIHESGSDRIAEAAEEIDADVIVNIQGDEPFIDIDGLKKIKELFLSDTEKKNRGCQFNAKNYRC